ncbi:MAG TPA: hypothetical protein VG841_10975 [Caulobacterales bacterium]|nr:hypothetical protein [Caulobacterales bacterium]
MRNAPLRFAAAALWPLSIWTSFSHLKEHPADDYVERTTPIVVCAVAFWIAFLTFVGLSVMLQDHLATVAQDDAQVLVRVSDRRWRPFADVLLYFLPAIYLTGLWLFSSRAERFSEEAAHKA